MFKLQVEFEHLQNMPSKLIPKEVMDRFHQAQKELGGNFHRQTRLNKRIYPAIKHVVDRTESEEHLTRIMLIGQGFILVHKHKDVTERLHVISMLDGAYGHLFYPKFHMLNLENLCGHSFDFEPNECHGLSILRGFALVKVEIFGKPNLEDVHV